MANHPMPDDQPFRFVLASGSLARRELLAAAGYHFEVMPSHVDEPEEAPDGPQAFVQDLAWRKAAAVARSVGSGVVLAADTVGWLRGRVIGKPADEADARRILEALGGTEHELWTGVCLWRRPNDFQLSWQERSIVAFQRLRPEELNRYLATRQWQGCSGAYAIQGAEDPFVRLVKGSRSNVLGLPMETLGSVLRPFAALAAMGG